MENIDKHYKEVENEWVRCLHCGTKVYDGKEKEVDKIIHLRECLN